MDWLPEGYFFYGHYNAMVGARTEHIHWVKLFRVVDVVAIVVVTVGVRQPENVPGDKCDNDPC